jgi:hypothetical protein
MVKYSFCMATYQDFYGVDSTIMGLLMYQDMTDCEIIVLDNDPKGTHANDVRGLVRNADENICPIHYHEMEGNSGTSATRHKLFELAKGELVIVMDCHVFLQQGAVARLKAFWESATPEMKKNLFTGPLLMDSLSWRQTHFECEWRSEMWGTWSTAWRKDGEYFVARESEDKTQLEMRRHMGTEVVYQFKHGWPGHERILLQNGFVPAGSDPDEPIFEIPAQGLGLFLGAKEHWLGFNPHHKHFGGEECYIHEKYRRAGRKTYCLPFMGWRHRFGRPEGPRYPISREGKMRNYVLEFMELGLDLEPIRKHFIDEVGLKPEVWDKCIADPINFDPFQQWAANTHPENMKPILKSNMGMDLPANMGDLEMMAVEVSAWPRDLHEHIGTFLKYGRKSNSVLEISKRRESTLFWAAGLNGRACSGACATKPCDCRSRLISYQAEQDSLIAMVVQSVDPEKGRLDTVDVYNKPLDGELPEVEGEFDTLYFDGRHTMAWVANTLEKYKGQINKYIVLRGVSASNSGNTSEDESKPGTFFALRNFVKQNPEWFVVHHSENCYGMTVLSKVAAERPEEPIKPWPPMDDEGNTCGVGSNIKALLKTMGIEASANCGCNAQAARLDAIGPDACELEIESILDYMYEQAKARSLESLFVRPAVRIAIQLAIRRARKKIKKGECF